MLCILLWVPGCFVWLPIVEVDPNMPPEITASSPPADATVVVSASGATVFIVVDDPNDPESLIYLWSIHGKGQVPDTPLVTAGLNGSQVDIAADPDFDGRQLEVWVSDSYGAKDSRSWTLNVETGP